jgi:CSLREA domain-containing protein
MRTSVRFASVLAGVLSVLALFSPASWATDFTVTTLQDRNNNSGVCAGDCSLREAIIAANRETGPHTITVPAGTITFDPGLGATGDDSAATGDLDITNDVTVQGQGRDTTIIDANGLDRVFHVFSTSETRGVAVAFRGLTMTGGHIDVGVGGGLFVESLATVALTDVAVSDNNTTNSNRTVGSGLGAGIYNSGTLALSNALITGNTATIDQDPRGSVGGGGLHNAATAVATIATSTISKNRVCNNADGAAADSCGAFATGGGVLNLGTLIIKTDSMVGGTSAADGNIAHSGAGISNLGGFLTVTGSTVRYNTTTIEPDPNDITSGQAGGGVFAQNAGTDRGNVLITETTVSDNYADRLGGGIFNSGAPLTLTMSVVNDNRARYVGGGLSNVSSTPTEVSNTTIYGNTAGDHVGVDLVNSAGGGLWTSSRINLASVTIAGNRAEQGQQIYLQDNSTGNTNSPPPQVLLTSAIIAHVEPDSSADKNCGGDTHRDTTDPDTGAVTGTTNYILSDKFNIETGNTCRLGGDTGFSDKIETDPLLDPAGLRNNGGRTRTVALQPGSPAVNHRDAGGCPAVDQRYYRRDGQCDTGAFELNALEYSSELYDLQVRILENKDPIQVDTQLIYTLQISNNSPRGDAANTFLGMTLPNSGLADEVFIQVLEGASGSCSRIDPTTISCLLDTIPALGTKRVSVTVVPQVAGSLSVTANVAAGGATSPSLDEGDLFKGNNTATEITTVTTDTGVRFPSTGSGGGSSDSWLLALLGLWAWQRRVRTRR